VNYIGSKRTLLPKIAPYLERAAASVGGRQASFLDLFAGTGIVSQLARALGYRVVACDIQQYAVVRTHALLLPPVSDACEQLAQARPTFGLEAGRPAFELEPLLRELERARAERAHPFVQAYVEGGAAGRLYFSADNGTRIAGIRDAIARMRSEGRIEGDVEALLLASLLEAADRVANTASVYGAYLKHLKRSAQAQLCLPLPRLVRADLAPGRAVRGDAIAVARALACCRRRFDLAYSDSPYNSRLYASNYHLLETIARWDLDRFVPRGKTGLRPAEEGASDFCSKRKAAAAFGALFASVPAERLLVSYSSEGIVPLKELCRLVVEAGFHAPRLERIGYRRFRADTDSDTRSYAGDEVVEYLLYAERA
jgi:adenine-specific DNA-methyltransferase